MGRPTRCLKKPSAELDIDAVSGVREDIGAQRREHALENRHRHQPDDDDIERRQAAVHRTLSTTT